MNATELKHIRAELRMTQAQLAANIGASIDALRHWERGMRTMRPVYEQRIREIAEKRREQAA